MPGIKSVTTGEEDNLSSADKTSDDNDDVAVHCDEVLLEIWLTPYCNTESVLPTETKFVEFPN